MPKDKVGFIGLGTMGKPMAVGLIGKSIDTIVFDVREEPIKELEKLGAKVARSAKEIGLLCNIIIVMVQTTEQAESILLSTDGVLNVARDGSIVAIMSTIDPLFCQRAAVIAEKRGVGLIDAPVTGGPKSAESHTLTIMVGGKKELLERCRPVFEAMGSRIFHIGDTVGSGEVMKVAANSIIYATAIGTAGGMALAGKIGIGLERFVEIVKETAANSWVIHNWDHWHKKSTPEGKTSLYITYKDLRLALDLAKTWDISLPVAELISTLDISKIIGDAERLAKEGSSGNKDLLD